MQHTLELFFDCSSPWTYLAFESLQKTLAKRDNVNILYRPILVGGIFNSINPSVYENRSNPLPIKMAYSRGLDCRTRYWRHFKQGKP